MLKEKERIRIRIRIRVKVETKNKNKNKFVTCFVTKFKYLFPPQLTVKMSKLTRLRLYKRTNLDNLHAH